MPAAIAAASVACALAVSLAAPASAASPTPTPSSGGSAAVAPGSCPDYEFIGARGSGEDNSIPSSTRYTAANPTWGMGGEIADVYKRIAATAAANDVTITPYGVPYPAVGIDLVSSDALVSGDLRAYSKSVELGAHAAAAELERVSRSCPETGVVVAGYSQGAQTIVDAVMQATPSARRSLVAAVFFGNTYFSSSDTRNDYGSFASGLDGYVLRSETNGDGASADSVSPGVGSVSGSAADGADWADDFGKAAVFDYCHNGDPICGLVDERTVDGVDYPVRDFAHIVSSNANGSGSSNIFTQHTTYQRGDTANAAQQLRYVLGLPLLDAGAPVAKITGPATAEAGGETRFNAGGGLSDPADPVVRYTWMIDQGTDDVQTLVTARPLMSTAFFTTGTHTVSLRTTTLTGAHATASTTVTAIASPTAAPAAPTKVMADPGDGAVTLSWPAVPGAEFYAVKDAGGKLLTAFTPLVAGQQTVSWTDSGLSNGRARGYRIYALNSMGRSAGSSVVSATPQAAPQRPAAPAVRLATSAATPVEPELAWSLGLGLIAAVLVLALVRTRPARPARMSRPRRLR